VNTTAARGKPREPWLHRVLRHSAGRNDPPCPALLPPWPRSAPVLDHPGL